MNRSARNVFAIHIFDSFQKCFSMAVLIKEVYHQGEGESKAEESI